MSVVGGAEWETCRTLLEAGVPGCVAQAVKDADTFFGVELSSATQHEKKYIDGHVCQ
jgi:3-oxoadipate enol-lactonase